MNYPFQVIASLGLNQGVECNQNDKCNIQNNIDTCTDYWMHDQLLCTNGDDFVCNVQAEDIHTHNCKEQDPDSEIENSVKIIFEIRIPNLCYIQVIVFDLSYLPVAAVGT